VVHEEDVELLEFSDEIEAWVIEQLRAGGYDTAKSVLRADIEDVARRADLEVETVQDVRNILTKEFDAE
jgi:transcription termination/antitermination protein NusA